MGDKFKARYEAEDGYCGGSRPQYFTIDSSDIEDDMTDEDLEDLFERDMQSAFEQKVYPCAKNREEFMEWAREQRAKRQAEPQ